MKKTIKASFVENENHEKFVAIPSKRGCLSDKLGNVEEVIGDLEVAIPSKRGCLSDCVVGRQRLWRPHWSQSPRSGAVFPTHIIYQHKPCYVSRNPLEAGLSFRLGDLAPLAGALRKESQSPRSGAVFPTYYS